MTQKLLTQWKIKLSDLYDTETFDTMEDKVYDAVNNLTVEDF